MELGNTIYRNDIGNIVTKEEFEQEWQKFEKNVNEAYDLIANKIISEINFSTHNDIQKLWLLYDYLTKENMKYNIQNTVLDGKWANDVQYDFPPYKNWKISHSTKYPALLNNSGVCKTYALAFEDLANKLGIPCRVITGYTGMEHAWNIVLISGEIKHIDVSYALMRRSFTNKKDFFLKSLDELIQNSGSRTVNEYDKLINDMTNPQIKVISRSDKENKPQITIIQKSSNEIDPKITILNKKEFPEIKSIKR